MKTLVKLSNSKLKVLFKVENWTRLVFDLPLSTQLISKALTHIICHGTKSTPNTIEINKVTHIKTYSHSKYNKVRHRNIYTNLERNTLGINASNTKLRRRKKKKMEIGNLVHNG